MPKNSEIPNPLAEYFDFCGNHSEAVDELRLSIYEAIAAMLENPKFDEWHRQICLKLTMITYSIDRYKDDGGKKSEWRFKRE